MLLLTDNRNMVGVDSLEQTIRDENRATSLPVITLSRADRVVEQSYRERCATRLLDIILDLDNYLGYLGEFLSHSLKAAFPAALCPCAESRPVQSVGRQTGGCILSFCRP